MTRLEKQEYWRELVALWESSGKNQREFCEDQQVVAATFSYWKKRLAQLDEDNSLEFFPLAVSGESGEIDETVSSGIILNVGQGRFSLDLSGDFSEETLLRVLRVLEAA